MKSVPQESYSPYIRNKFHQNQINFPWHRILYWIFHFYLFITRLTNLYCLTLSFFMIIFPLSLFTNPVWYNFAFIFILHTYYLYKLKKNEVYLTFFLLKKCNAVNTISNGSDADINPNTYRALNSNIFLKLMLVFSNQWLTKIFLSFLFPLLAITVFSTLSLILHLLLRMSSHEQIQLPLKLSLL